MAILLVNERSKIARAFLDFVKDLKFVSIVEDLKPNETTRRAIKESKEGKTIRCEDFEDYLKKVKFSNPNTPTIFS